MAFYATKKSKRNKKNYALERRYFLPAFFLVLALFLMLLPLEGPVSSIKAVLAYVFIPQVRLAHDSVQYSQNVSQTVRELLDAHRENVTLKQQMETTQLAAQQAQQVFEENERLSQILSLQKTSRWKGVWANVAYRDPTQWNTITIDKGALDGVRERSAVIAAQQGKEGLAGIVVEVTDHTAKVILVRDENFSAAVILERGKEEGLLVGDGQRAVKIKYIPLSAQIERGDKIYTSSASSIFPAGILVGEVLSTEEDGSFKTAYTVRVEPVVKSASVREVFVILGER